MRMGKSAAEELQDFFGCNVSVSGHILLDSLQKNENGLTFLLACKSMNVSAKNIPYNKKIQVFINKDIASVSGGDIVVKGELAAAKIFRNWGCFDYSSWNRSREIGGILSKSVIVEHKDNVWWRDRFAQLNDHLRKKVTTAVPGEVGIVMQNLAFGGTKDLPEETREEFAALGIAHMLSVSGTHLILVADFLTAILSGIMKRKGKIIISAFLIGYAALCGFKPPVVRALFMSCAMLWGGNGADRGRIMSAAATVMALYNPLWLLDIGFQLSFAAAWGIIYLKPKLHAFTDEYLPAVISETVAVTLAAQAAVLPVEVYNFHQLSLFAVVGNILLVPLLEVVMIMTMLGSFAELLFQKTFYLLSFAGFLTEQILKAAARMSRLPFALIIIGTVPGWSVWVYYTTVLIYADVGWGKIFSCRERRMIIFFCCCCVTSMLLWQQLKERTLTLYMLDVGQGDACVVVAPDKSVIVIDTGGLKNFDTGSRVLVPFLKYLGVHKVHALLLSHWDQDHSGGAESLARSVEIKQIILPRECLTEAYKNKLRRLRRYSSEILTADFDMRWNFSDIALRIVDVPEEGVSGNDASTLAEIEDKRYGYKILFTGDMSEQREGTILKRMGRYNVLKVGHHGSKNSSSEEFLQTIKPQLALISAGVDNKYGHPHGETLARLDRIGAKILRTDQSGCIKVEFYAEGIVYSGYKDF